MKRYIFLFLFSLFLISCATTGISSIKRSPGEYRDRKVSVRGTVISVKVVGEFNIIKLRDPEGEEKIYCIKHGKSPELNKKLFVSGYVRVIPIPLLKDFVYIVDKDSDKKFNEFKQNNKDKFQEFLEIIKSEMKF